MVILRKSYQEIINTLKEDIGLELRFTTRVVFINNLSSYIRMVKELSDLADEVIKLSDAAYCGGQDSIPDLTKVLEHITKARDKNLVITSIGEYLRFARKWETREKNLYSIMTLPMHSSKRVWIPIYAAKDLFQDVVKDLSEERYELYELDEEADEFDCFVYSDAFLDNSGTVIQGLRQLFFAWDDLSISSGVSFSTKRLALITPSTGNYAVHVVKSPFEYLQKHLKSPNAKLVEELGTAAHWAKLATYAVDSDGSLESILEKALNVASFDAQQIVSSWGYLSNDKGFGKWVLWLWYKLGLAAAGDYLGFAIQRAETYDDIQNEIECAIFSCVSNPSFDVWVSERMKALKNMGVTELSSVFWKGFSNITDERTKLKLLSNTTHKERTTIIEIISDALKKDKRISDYKSILAEKYPDLLLYFKESVYIKGVLGEYIQAYKQFKIMDYFDLSISETAYDVDPFEFDSRSKILNSIKCSKTAYYLWIDGMGIEWIDMLIEKVVSKNNCLSNPTVEIGMAVMPTTTSANMAKADPETVSQKFNSLDSLSHIKDKSDCNYFSIVEKQFEMIGMIADLIVKIVKENPGLPIVVTADHGMSRMAAKAFHEKQGITPPSVSEVENLGRYCILPADANPYDYGRTYREDNCLAYRDHSHFTCSGYAPGEIHGGASPEEWLVPIIVFADVQKKNTPDTSATYKLIDTSLKPDFSGNIDIRIKTTGDIKSLVVEQGMNSFIGKKVGTDIWSVLIPNLQPGNDYEIRVHLNNVFSKKIEVVSVKRRGLDVDDDF